MFQKANLPPGVRKSKINNRIEISIFEVLYIFLFRCLYMLMVVVIVLDFNLVRKGRLPG